MDRKLSYIGLLATVLIVVVLATTALREPQRQVTAAAELQSAEIAEGKARITVPGREC